MVNNYDNFSSPQQLSPHSFRLQDRAIEAGQGRITPIGANPVGAAATNTSLMNIMPAENLSMQQPTSYRSPRLSPLHTFDNMFNEKSKKTYSEFPFAKRPTKSYKYD